MYCLLIVAAYHLFQICSTLSPTSKNVCPKNLPPVGNLVRNTSKDALTVECCPNFIEKNDICEPCPVGTYGKFCINQCELGSYGIGCNSKCNCSTFQECHNIFGCVCQAGFTGNRCDKECQSGYFGVYCTEQCDCPYSAVCDPINGTCSCPIGYFSPRCEDITSAENTVTTIVATVLPTEAIIIEETTIKNCGPPTKDWLLYTLGTAGFIILTVLSHLLRSYRKRKSRLKNGEVVLESTTTSPYTGVYHEIDENVLTDVTLGVCLISQSSNNEAVYFVPQERTSITTITEHIDTDYLDPVFAAEDEGNKSKDQMCKKESISTCSSDSDAIVSTSNENINPSKFKENRHEHSHGYNVLVTVHPCIESSSGTDEDATDNKYSHVYQSLQKDSQIKNNDYEKLRTTESMIHVIVNDATLQPVTQSIHGTNEFPHCINMYAGSDKTINSCDGMRIRDEDIFDNNKLTTGDKKTVDAVECKKSHDN